MNITFSMGNGVTNTALKFFPPKTPYRLNESQKTSFGGRLSVVLLDRLIPEKIEFTHRWTRTNHMDFIKTGSKLQTVS